MWYNKHNKGGVVMNFNERLNEALVIRRMSQAELSKITGIGKSSISQYVSGAYEAKQDKIFLISRALRVDPAWLMGKDVPMEGDALKATAAVDIPLIGTIAAGTPILAEQNIEKYFSLDSSIKADFCLKVKGDSMIDEGIMPGDIVFIRQQPTLENGEIGAIILGDEATLKRFYKNNGQIVLQPANKNYQPMFIKHSSVKIAGKLVAVLNIKE